MKWFKTALAAAGLMVAASAAHASTITDRAYFERQNNVLFDASNGPASTKLWANAPADTVVDGKVQIDIKDIDYWWKRRGGQSSWNAKTEQAKSWNFTLSHDGQTADLGGLPGAVDQYWFKTTAFDGVTTGGAWVLTATSDYWKDAKRMIQFDIAGFFDYKAAPTTSSSSSGGSVPVPATALLILMGLAGIGAASRREAADT